MNMKLNSVLDFHNRLALRKRILFDIDNIPHIQMGGRHLFVTFQGQCGEQERLYRSK